MRKLLLHEKIAPVGFGIITVGIGIFAYWNSTVEDLGSWDYEYKFLPVFVIFGGGFETNPSTKQINL